MTIKTLQILTALADGPLHGYGIKQAVEERTVGRVSLGSGTLYEAVHRLQTLGWIVEVDAEEPAGATSGGPPRRVYALTDTGREAAARELRGLADLVRLGKRTGLIPETG